MSKETLSQFNYYSNIRIRFGYLLWGWKYSCNIVLKCFLKCLYCCVTVIHLVKCVFSPYLSLVRRLWSFRPSQKKRPTSFSQLALPLKRCLLGKNTYATLNCKHISILGNTTEMALNWHKHLVQWFWHVPGDLYTSSPTHHSNMFLIKHTWFNSLHKGMKSNDSHPECVLLVVIQDKI